MHPAAVLGLGRLASPALSGVKMGPGSFAWLEVSSATESVAGVTLLPLSLAVGVQHFCGTE